MIILSKTFDNVIFTNAIGNLRLKDSFLWYVCAFIHFKHGGLDSRDQSRSRSRTSFVSRLTFENRRECPSYWDQLFFFSVEIFKIETFQLRKLKKNPTAQLVVLLQQKLKVLRNPTLYLTITIFSVIIFLQENYIEFVRVIYWSS